MKLEPDEFSSGTTASKDMQKQRDLNDPTSTPNKQMKPSIISCKSFSHRLNFFIGSAIVKSLVFIFQPRKTKHSDNWPSSANLLRDRQSSRLIGSEWSIGRHKVCMANN